MTAKLCEARYQRPGGQMLACQYLDGHPTLNHSWWAASMQDQHEASVDPDAVLAWLSEGWFDPFLEAILAAAHARKRELRGVFRPYGVVR